MDKTMKCPKCHSDFEQLNTPFGDVERCLNCKGLWLDMLQHEDLKDIAESIDIGDPDVGKQYNELSDTRCPVCANSSMLRMVDVQQPHIWFESCPTCYGRFYDAGEFRDLNNYSILDFFRDLLARERK